MRKVRAGRVLVGRVLVFVALLGAGGASSFSLAVRVGGGAHGPGVVTPAEEPTRPIGG